MPEQTTVKPTSPILFLAFAAITGFFLFPGIFQNQAFRQAASLPLTLAYIAVFVSLVLFLSDSWIKPLSRNVLLGALCIAVLAILVIYIRGYFPYLDMNGDNAGYILRAQSLMQGKGFRDLNLPGQPWNAQLYNVGWSVLLIPFLALFGTNFSLINIAPLLFTLGSIPLLYAVSRRFLPRGLSLAVALLMAVNQELLHFSSLVMTENPMIFFSLLALLMILKYEEEGNNLGPALWFSALALFFCVLVRLAAFPLPFAAVLGLVVRKQFKKAALLGVILLVLFGGFFAMRSSLRNAHPATFREIPSMQDATPQTTSLKTRLSSLFSSKTFASAGYAALVLPEKILDYPYKSQEEYRGGGKKNILLLLLVLSGLFFTLKSRRYVIPVYFAGLSAVVILLLTEYPVLDLAVMSRYLIPLIPLLYLFSAIGLDRFKNLIAGKVPRMTWLGIGSAALIFLLLTAAALKTLSIGIAQSRQGLPPSYANYLKLAEWGKTHLPPEAVIGARKDNIFSLVSGRKTVMYYYQGTGYTRYSSYDAEMDRLTHQKFKELPVSYVVFDTFSGDAFNKLLPILRQNPDKFRTVTAIAGNGQQASLPEKWWMNQAIIEQLPRSAAAILLSYHPDGR